MDKTPIRELPYPEGADIIAEYPLVAKKQMEDLDVHSHGKITSDIDIVSAKLDDAIAALASLKKRKYAVFERATVTQKKNKGFNPPKNMKNPVRSIMAVQSGGFDARDRVFACYNKKDNKFFIVQVAASISKGDPAATIPQGTYNVIFFEEKVT